MVDLPFTCELRNILAELAACGQLNELGKSLQRGEHQLHEAGSIGQLTRHFLTPCWRRTKGIDGHKNNKTVVPAYPGSVMSSHLRTCKTMTINEEITLTILMPCLNEARTLPVCIAKARSYIARQSFRSEIVIVDNGSNDGSREIADSLGARVIAVPQRGYGNALRKGIEGARGKFVIMGDSDGSYDFGSLDAFVEKLEAGYDLVVGNRFGGGIENGAMPALHKYFGNPMLSAIGRILYRSPLNDFYCGLRGFRREAMLRLGMNSAGMEFALEMIVKSSINHLRLTEVPTKLFRDGRERPSHLQSWRDGWRSLRFFLLLSPDALFLYPGLVLAIISGSASVALIFSDIRLGTVTFAHHTLIITSALTIIGLQSVFFWVFAKIVAIQKKLLFADAMFERIRPLFTLQACLPLGGGLIAIGVGTAAYALFYWYRLSFDRIEGDILIKAICAASFLIGVGFQLVFASFFIYLLDQQTHNSAVPSPVDSLHCEKGTLLSSKEGENRAVAADKMIPR
jgi:glycosyltransferase involved in cell wall biosynthesis